MAQNLCTNRRILREILRHAARTSESLFLAWVFRYLPISLMASMIGVESNALMSISLVPIRITQHNDT